MQYNPNQVEQEILAYWENKKIFKKLVEKNKGKKRFSFIDGPITANNPMGVHHAWGRTYKDVYQRYKAMQGYDQRYQNGFDCQGLWLEVETEKELGFNSKKDIEHFGLDKFSKACRLRVEKFSKIQTEQSIKLGQWMDWSNSYYTMSDKNIEYIWYFLKKCHEKGWLYRGTKILPWCTRCGTSSSQHEMSDGGYADLTHKAVYIKAKIKGRENEYLLIWTTTEWTLSSNVAAAVNPNLNYAVVKKGKEIYYLSEAMLSKLGGDCIVLDTIQGHKLLGTEYESFYPDIEAQKDIIHKVVPWEEVGEAEGTGIVHIAPTCGEEDYELAKKLGLKIIKPALDDFGTYNPGFGWLSGKNVNKIKEDIIADLDKRGILYKTEDYTHRYPICWRCGKPLVFRMDYSWFIKCDEIRPLMKKAASAVIWSPEHIGKLMQDWLDNMGDWNISRKRYWGLPLMFYECGCGHLEVIGSLKELKQKAVNPKKVDALPEFHRPWIDEIRITCSKCGKEISRIPEIGDCWLDAGIVPFSTLKYLDDKKYWSEWFPAELVIEMRAQTRLWFYAMLFMSVTLENKAPYKSVFAYEVVKDEKGEDMHKSKGNAIWFDEAVEKMGADVMRFMYTAADPTSALRFGYTPAKEAKKLLDIIWNTANYVSLYCKDSKQPSNLDITSKWILSRLESTKLQVTSSLEKLQPELAMKAIQTFLIDDLSRSYGQFIRDDLHKPGIQHTLQHCYLEGLKLLAPFLPFITEKIYMDLTKKESIFLESWSEIKEPLINEKLEQHMKETLLVMQEILAQREKSQIGIKWPLASAKIYTPNDKAVLQLVELLKKQTNIKTIEIINAKELKVELDLNLTPELEKEGFTREVIRRIQALRKKANLNKEDKIILDITVEQDIFLDQVKEKANVKEFKVIQDPEISSTEKIKGKLFEIKFNTIKE